MSRNAANTGLSSKAPTRARTRVSTKTSQTSWTEEEDALLSKLMESNSSSSPELISANFPDKTQQQVLDRWNKVLNPELIKGSWTTQEDEIITQWVTDHGPRNWSTLAATLPGRLGKQCRERWVNNLSPELTHQPWTEEEDKLLIEHQQKWGNKWAKIAALLPGRTDNSVKNRWNSSLKRKLQRIANGEAPYNKRGRKPKRASNAPDVAPIIQSKTEITIQTKSTEEMSVPIKNEKSSKPIGQVLNKNKSEEVPVPTINENPQTDMPKPDFNVDLSIPSPAGTHTPMLLSPFIQMSPILMKDSPFFPLWSPGSNADSKAIVLKSPVPFTFDGNESIEPQKIEFKINQ